MGASVQGPVGLGASNWELRVGGLSLKEEEEGGRPLHPRTGAEFSK